METASPTVTMRRAPPSRLATRLELEPNEDGTPSTVGSGVNGNDFGTTFADANGAYTASVTIRGAISPVGDEDVFLFRNTSTTRQVLFLETWSAALGVGVPCGLSIDTAIVLRNVAGVALASNDDRQQGVEACSIVHIALEPGASVYAHVLAFDDNATIPGYGLVADFVSYTCGNHIDELGEQCDDGGIVAGDDGRASFAPRGEHDVGACLDEGCEVPPRRTGPAVHAYECAFVCIGHRSSVTQRTSGAARRGGRSQFCDRRARSFRSPRARLDFMR